ncbi:MAG: dehydrogenase, short-chain alcohol dehydrogenase like protein [Bacteriovoracaceae bacterium]|nr:dehydrogenase, short-chain alcohol dehydrogenase like protein [Bacteriovoracaceae bacterium]
MSARSLENKVAIITGGGRGIGAATAEVFIREGAKVVIASRSEKELKETAQKLKSENIFCVPTDVSDEASVKNLFNQTIKKFGKLDILINNAGIFLGSEFSKLSTEDWDRVIGVNLRGPFLCAREAFLKMSGGGSIVNISSLAGIRGTQKFPGFTSYVASKFGVVGLTESLAVEGRDRGIRVNCVAPGGVDTKMLKEALPSLKAEAQPKDIAEIILSLCDESRSAVLTGTLIEVFTKVTPR